METIKNVHSYGYHRPTTKSVKQATTINMKDVIIIAWCVGLLAITITQFF